tara:strand:- start:145 stop:894 length:750 start_codon:yes stop_codon:yes gene_type:complete
MFGLIPGFPFSDKVRFIVPDRPGYGMSDTYKHGFSVIDYYKDIRELADYLELDKFSIFAFSGAAAYALVCAWRMPDRILNVGIYAGVGPLNELSERGILSPLKLLYWASDTMPSVAKGIMNSVGLLIRKNFSLYNKLLRSRLTESERILHSKLRPAEGIVLDRIEGFRQGGRASTYDISLARNWPVPLGEISTEVHIWQGSDDRYTGSMGEYMAELIPNSHLNIVDGEGHYWIIDHLEEMLAPLVESRL